MFRSRCSLLAVLLTWSATVWALQGCQSVPLFSKVKHRELKSCSKEHPLIECICLWEPGEGTGIDGLPCRGFAGQLLFFAQGYPEPVKIDGDVSIYVFDDQGSLEEQSKPIHQFNFEGAVFQAFMTETNLGAAYQLFIPYTRTGNHRAACTLRVKVAPESSSPVYSKMATVLLPGVSSRQEPLQITRNNEPRHCAIQQAGYEIEVPATQQRGSTRQLEAPAQLPVATINAADRAEMKARLTEAAKVAVDNKVIIEQKKVPAHLLHQPAAPTTPMPAQKHPLLDE